MKRFRDYGLKKKYDFSFTGGLHASHTDMRFLVKNELFRNKHINIKSNKGLSALFKYPIKKEFKLHNIFWAEWGAKDFFYRSLLPTGKKYGEFMNQSKVFLNTPSAMGIFNTRFFELMATKSLILCPESDSYDGFLRDNENCVMFKKDMTNFKEKYLECIEDEIKRERIINRAFDDVKNHSYNSRISQLLSKF